MGISGLRKHQNRKMSIPFLDFEIYYIGSPLSVSVFKFGAYPIISERQIPAKFFRNPSAKNTGRIWKRLVMQ